MASAEIKFTIITPTYNRAHLIGKTIESVLRQTYPNWELLICDDASTDNTPELVASFRDARIRYLRSPVNGGNAAARNLGLKHSSSTWITFVDSDDTYDPEYLKEFFLKIGESDEPRFLFCGYRVVRDSKTISTVTWNPVSMSRGSFLYDLKIGIGCGVMFHRKCLDEVGIFDERLRVAVDTDFLIRMELKYSFTVIDKVLIAIQTHDGPRVRKDPVNIAKSYQIIIAKHEVVISGDKELARKWYYKFMWLQYHAGNVKGGNATYTTLKESECMNVKIRFIHAIFNILPSRLAKFIHKNIS